MVKASNNKLRQQIGQMLMLGFSGTTLADTDNISQAIMQQQIGGVILFDYDYQKQQFGKNITSPEQVRLLTRELQNLTKNAAKQHGTDEHPLFIAIDYEGGKVNRLHERYGFPATLSQQQVAAQGEGAIAAHAAQMANTLAAAGINVNFSPCVDVNVNPNNPVIGQLGRSFSADPAVVASCAEMYAEAYTAVGVASVYKHFPGHGSSQADTHFGFVDVTDSWQAQELLPYHQLLEQSAPTTMVMMAHIVNRTLEQEGLPASLSYAIVTRLLREQLNYQGLVITDDLQMKAICDHFSLVETVSLAINAGVDILLFGNQLSPHYQSAVELIDIIEQGVYEGDIDSANIVASAQRIGRFKLALAGCYTHT